MPRVDEGGGFPLSQGWTVGLETINGGGQIRMALARNCDAIPSDEGARPVIGNGERRIQPLPGQDALGGTGYLFPA